jgi:Mrp family chromosome partitioning ATPase
VLVTSGHAGEGKTTTIANLAASFAEAGQQVLVLDADLRSPDVHQHFDVPQAEGISNYLAQPRRLLRRQPGPPDECARVCG